MENINLSIPFCKPKKIRLVGKFDEVFTPDFGMIGELYKEGYTSDLDLALQKPQYQGVVNAGLVEIPSVPSPNLPDDVLLDTLPSREYDVNELREIAINFGDEYSKQKSESKSN